MNINSDAMDMIRKMKGKAFMMMAGLALMLCGACHEAQEEEPLYARILTIKAAGDSVPEQALASLDSLREEVMMSGFMHLERTYELTEIRLRDKADWAFHSDDTITMLCRYFERHGSPTEQMEAQYYLGRVSREIKNYPQAVEGFLRAIAIGESGAEVELPVLQWAYSQMSGVYTSELNREGALEMAQKGLELSRRTGTVDPIYIMDVGNAAIHSGDTSMAMKYYDEAIAMIRQEGSGRNYLDVIGALLVRFSRAGRKADADYCLACLDSLPARRRPHNYLSGLASYYNQFISADSAAQVYQRIYETSTTWARKIIPAWALMNYYYEKGDYQKSSFYGMALHEANNAVLKERELEQTAIASGEQLYRRSREAEQEAREAAARYKIYMLCFAIAGMGLILASSLFYNVRQKQYLNALRKKNQTIDGMQKELEDINLQLAEKQEALEQVEGSLRGREEELESLNGKVSRATAELNEKDKGLRVTRMQLGKAKKQVKTQHEKMEATQAELKRAQKKVHDLVSCEAAARADGETTSLVNRIVNEMRTSRTGVAEISDGEWNLLAAHIEAMYPGFHQSLKEGIRDVSPRKLRVALLWKIGMSKAQIARQMDFSPQTASRWVEEIEAAMNLG